MVHGCSIKMTSLLEYVDIKWEHDGHATLEQLDHVCCAFIIINKAEAMVVSQLVMFIVTP